MNTIKFKLYAWLSFRFLFNKKVFFGGSGPLSVLGLILGVAALVTSQAVMRGFESTLKSAVIDTTGDLQIVRKGKLVDSWSDFQNEIISTDSRVTHLIKFASTEAVMASRGKVSGVMLQGLESKNLNQVLNLNPRLREGKILEKLGDITIGLGLVKKYNLKIGDRLYIAVPLSTPFENTKLQRQASEYIVGGIVDFGKNDWNERLVLLDISDLQKLTKIGDRFTGAYAKISNSDQVVDVTNQLNQNLDRKYYINNWFNINRNLIEAVHLEKIVIFFVVFLIVLMAAFNISSTLYVVVRSRMKDIAILKTLGFTAKNIQSVFIFQGVLIGTLGTLGGYFFGLLLSYGFVWLQRSFSIISGSVYKLDRIDVQFSFLDIILIYIATLGACLLASYYPAKRASRLTIIDGFRND